MSHLLEPFAYGFMRDALWVGTAVAVMCAVLSCFLVLRGWALMGDALAHAVLPGIVLAYLAGLPLILGAFIAGVGCSSAIGFIREHSRIRADTVMGVVFTGMFAFGLVLFSRTPSDLHLDHILVGSILGIPRAEMWRALIISVAVVVPVWLLRRDLLVVCFDAAHARVLGLRSRLLDQVLLALLAMAVVAALQAVGIILVVAMLVTPGSIGRLWADRFDRMLCIAVASAVFSTVTGILISFHIHGSSSACIVLMQTLIFVISLVAAPKYGLLAMRQAERSR